MILNSSMTLNRDVDAAREAAARGMLLPGLRPVDEQGRRTRPGIAWRAGRLRSPNGVRAAGPRLELADHLAFAGLINAHDHLQLNLFPPLLASGDPELSLPVRDVSDWVDAMRQRIERPDHLALRSLPAALRAWHGGLKNILAGTTTVVHHDPPLDLFRRPGFPVHVSRRMGWAHSVGLASRYGPDLTAAWKARDLDRPWFIHLAEGRDGRAAAEFRLLLSVTGLSRDLRLVHGIGMAEADRRLAIAAGLGLIACPISNQRLLGRPGPIRDFAAAGQAALGSDSRLTGGRDLLAELRFAWSAGLATSAELLSMVGAGAARLLGEPGRGKLVAGLPADLIVIADDGRPPAAQLCTLQRAGLRLVLRGGRPRVADPDFEPLFAVTRTPWQAVVLDGRPKLVASDLLAPLIAAGIGEPGLELAS